MRLPLVVKNIGTRHMHPASAQQPVEALVIRSIASGLRQVTEDVVQQKPPLRIRLLICHLNRWETER
jgi:hypothetical protein